MKKYFLSIFLLLILVASCKKEEVTNITESNTSKDLCTTHQIDPMMATAISGPLQWTNPAPIPADNYINVRTDAGITVGVSYTKDAPAIGARVTVKFNFVEVLNNSYQYTVKPMDFLAICGMGTTSMLVFRRSL